MSRIRAHYALCQAARRHADAERAVSHALAAIGAAREALLPIWVAWMLSFLSEAPDVVGIERARDAAEEALAIFRAEGSPWGQANTLQILAAAARDRGQIVPAATLLHESLMLRGTLCEPSGIFEGLIHAAALAARWGDFVAATRLIGATGAWTAERGLARRTKELLEHTLADARAHLGEARFAAAWAEGMGISRGDALAEAQQMLAEIVRSGSKAEQIAALPTDTGTHRAAFSRTRLTALSGPPRAAIAPLERLTQREQEVLGLLCQRLSDAEIANQLYIGTRTVEFHVANVLGKLGAANRRDAAAIAARWSLV
jgi:DNA-binding CsgD family transcriptional regulator